MLGEQKAIRVAERHPGPIALVATDAVMPRMSGPDLAARLFASRPDVRVLFMSGDTDDATIRAGALSGGVAFLGKPSTLDALLRKVRAVLDAPAPARA